MIKCLNTTQIRATTVHFVWLHLYRESLRLFLEPCLFSWTYNAVFQIACWMSYLELRMSQTAFISSILLHLLDLAVSSGSSLNDTHNVLALATHSCPSQESRQGPKFQMIWWWYDECLHTVLLLPAPFYTTKGLNLRQRPLASWL